MDIFFWCVFAFIALDLALLRRRSPDAAMRAFSCSPLRTATICSLLVFLVCAGLPGSASPQRYLFVLLTLFMSSLYITGRRRYKFLLRVSGAETAGPKLILLSEFLEVVLLFCMWGLSAGILYGLASEVYPALKSRMVQSLAGYMFMSTVSIALIYRLGRQQQVLSTAELTAMGKGNNGAARLYLLPVLLGVLWAVVCSVVMLSHPQIPSTPFSKMVHSIDSSRILIMFLLLAVAAAPFIEELVFRGAIFAVVQRLMGAAAAFMSVTVLFALLHVQQYWGDGVAIAAVGALSALLTWLRVRSGSVIPGMVLHVTFNASMMIVPAVLMVLGNPYFEYQVKREKLAPVQREELLLKSIRKNPDFAPAYNDLAWSYAEDGRNLPEALRLAGHAVSLAPDNPAYQDTRAEVLFKMGRIDEAVAIETPLVARNPDHLLLKQQLEKFQAAQRNARGH